jgi:hypothetical protein
MLSFNRAEIGSAGCIDPFQRLRNWIIGKVQTQQLFFPAQNLFLISSSLIDQR